MTTAGAPAVWINGLRYRWREQDAFCLHIDRLEVPLGQRLFIHGPSGSGKSTLLNLVAAVLRPHEGELQLLGRTLAGWSPAALDAFRADHVGIIFQQFNLIPYLSVMKNVLLPCAFSRSRAARAGQPAERARALLLALEIDASLHHAPASRLSVGQQQRVAAARALIGRPEIVIADEPTSALDASRQAGFLQLLLHEAREAGSTVLFVSHDLTLARHFDTQFALAP